MDDITSNPVILVFGLFMTVFAGVGVWTFATALLTRRVDVKGKDAKAISDLETASREFREEVRQDNAKLDAKIDSMREAFIPLINVLDDLLPKMIPCLTEDEKLLLRDRVNAARKKT